MAVFTFDFQGQPAGKSSHPRSDPGFRQEEHEGMVRREGLSILRKIIPAERTLA